jgi:hypothetical protein
MYIYIYTVFRLQHYDGGRHSSTYSLSDIKNDSKNSSEWENLAKWKGVAGKIMAVTVGRGGLF